MALLEQARDQGTYLTLAEIARMDYDGKDRMEAENQALMKLRERPPEEIEKLSQRLAQDGIRKMRPYGWGHNAFVADTTWGQLVRITPLGHNLPFGEESKRPDCPRVLGSIKSYEIEGAKKDEGWRVEYVNKVIASEPCTAQDMKNVQIILAKYGLIVWDPKVENLMRLGDGTPIFVDADTVRKPDPGDEKELSSMRYYASLPAPPYYWGERSPEYRSTWIQCKQFHQLNPASPTYQKMIGMVTNDELDWLRTRTGRSSTLVKSLEDGLYPEQLPAELLAEYSKQHAAFAASQPPIRADRRR